jgi:hypothetical protein
VAGCLGWASAARDRSVRAWRSSIEWTLVRDRLVARPGARVPCAVVASAQRGAQGRIRTSTVKYSSGGAGPGALDRARATLAPAEARESRPRPPGALEHGKNGTAREVLEQVSGRPDAPRPAACSRGCTGAGRAREGPRSWSTEPTAKAKSAGAFLRSWLTAFRPPVARHGLHRDRAPARGEPSDLGRCERSPCIAPPESPRGCQGPRGRAPIADAWRRQQADRQIHGAELLDVR